jgi:hypothetical protein
MRRSMSEMRRAYLKILPYPYYSTATAVVGLSRGKVEVFFYLDRLLLRSVWEIAAEPSEYRAPHQDFGSCREIGAKTHWGSMRTADLGAPAGTALPTDARLPG